DLGLVAVIALPMRPPDLLPPLGIRAWTFVLNRLPRPCRTEAITTFSSYELRVFQTLADHATERLDESALVIVFALVESKRLLIAIPKQMKRFDIHVSSLESAFQKRPEVFEPVSVNLTACVAFQMVNDLSVVI